MRIMLYAAGASGFRPIAGCRHGGRQGTKSVASKHCTDSKIIYCCSYFEPRSMYNALSNDVCSKVLKVCSAWLEFFYCLQEEWIKEITLHLKGAVC